MPIAIAATAATAAAADRTGSVNRRRSGTTFGRSLRPAPGSGSRSEAGGCGPPAARRERGGDLPETLQLVAARLARGEVRLVGSPLVRVERVERVAGGQFV